MLRIFKIIIIPIVFIYTLNAQDRYESFPTWIKSVPGYGFNGMQNALTQKSNLLIIGTAGLGALLAYKYDDRIQDYAQRKRLLPHGVSQFGNLYGGIWSACLLPVSIIISSKASDETNREMLEKLEFAASALVANGVTTIILKELIGKERPNGSNNRSMPSGHTSHSFAVAAVANELYGCKVGTIAYLIAGLVAVSRINDNDHYLSDVIVGAGLGTIIGRGFAKMYQEKIYIPNLSVNSNGITFTYNF